MDPGSDLGNGPGVPTLDADRVVTFRYELCAGESPSHGLATVMSAITGTNPTEVGPLGNHLDLEAMNTLLGSTDEEGLLSGSVVLGADGITLAVHDSEIVGVARRDVAGWSPSRD